MVNIIQKLKQYVRYLIMIPTLTFITIPFPATTHYMLKSYDFGGGGGVGVGPTYSMEGKVGQVAGEQVGNSYKVNSGLMYVQQANEPSAPTFQNDGTNSLYNKLQFIINNGSNPTDATFAIAITSDNWVTTRYIQANDTIGTNPVFQTYTNWGGASGQYVIGLSPNTTYKIKVTATQGKYTQSPFSPEASAATTDVSLNFDIYVAPIRNSCSGSTGINTLLMGDLPVNTPSISSYHVCVDIDTNAVNGGSVYLHDQNSGLRSTATAHTISSLTGDLTLQSEGFGAQAEDVTLGQTSGGPMIKVNPYDGAGDNVGIINSTIRQIFSSSGAPVTQGVGSFEVKAKTSVTTPSADDYTDVITVVGASAF